MRIPSRNLRRRFPLLESLEALNPVSSLVAGIDPPVTTSARASVIEATPASRAEKRDRLADEGIRPLILSILPNAGAPSVRSAAGLRGVAADTTAQRPTPTTFPGTPAPAASPAISASSTSGAQVQQPGAAIAAPASADPSQDGSIRPMSPSPRRPPRFR